MKWYGIIDKVVLFIYKIWIGFHSRRVGSNSTVVAWRSWANTETS